MNSIQVPPTRREIWVGMLLYPRHTLPTAFAPALLAGSLALRNETFHLWALLAAFGAGWLIQLAGVITDNYHNLTRHPDDREHARFVAGLRAGVVRLAELRLAIVGCYLLAILLGLYLAWLGGWPVIVIGLASILASLAYSSNPYPLGDHALGEPLFYLFFGPVSFFGCYYVQAAASGAQAFPLDGIPVSLGLAALTTNILVIDNIRDLEYDKAKNEITLAVLIGERWSFVEYGLLLASAYLMPVLLWALGGFPSAILLPLLSIPYAVWVFRRLLRSSTFEERIPLTPQAGQVLLAYALLLGLGIVL